MLKNTGSFLFENMRLCNFYADMQFLYVLCSLENFGKICAYANFYADMQFLPPKMLHKRIFFA